MPIDWRVIILAGVTTTGCVASTDTDMHCSAANCAEHNVVHDFQDQAKSTPESPSPDPEALGFDQIVNPEVGYDLHIEKLPSVEDCEGDDATRAPGCIALETDGETTILGGQKRVDERKSAEETLTRIRPGENPETFDPERTADEIGRGDRTLSSAAQFLGSELVTPAPAGPDEDSEKEDLLAAEQFGAIVSQGLIDQ